MDSMCYMASSVKSETARSKDGHGGDTSQQIWVTLMCSLMYCWLGVHPIKDWHIKPFAPDSIFFPLAGKPLLGGIRFVVWNMLGDFCGSLQMCWA